jgi:hypothetical protein
MGEVRWSAGGGEIGAEKVRWVQGEVRWVQRR